MTTVAGWYGKLPTLGDFASRRLSQTFIEPWDAWLAAGLAHWQRRAPDTWLADYLAGPSLRFVLMPGVLAGSPEVQEGGPANAPVAGVLMPSVDRVGRYFPFTLAAPLSRRPAHGSETNALLAWLQNLDDLALDALQDDWSIERLESELARTDAAPPSWDAGSAPAAAAAIPGPEPANVGLKEFLLPSALSDWLDAGVQTMLDARLAGQAWWLCGGPDGPACCLRVTQGLPRDDDFVALMRVPAASGAATAPPSLS